MTTALAQKKADELVKVLRELQKLPANKRCMDCSEKGPQYACISFATFVCTTCSGIHREFGHRVKGISMSNFTAEEVDKFVKGGNEVAASLYLARWDPRDFPLPEAGDKKRIHDFIRYKYVDKRWFSAAGAGAGAGAQQGAQQGAAGAAGAGAQQGNAAAGQHHPLPQVPVKKPAPAVAPRREDPLSVPTEPIGKILGNDVPKLVVEAKRPGAAAAAAAPAIDLLGGFDSPVSAPAPARTNPAQQQQQQQQAPVVDFFASAPPAAAASAEPDWGAFSSAVITDPEAEKRKKLESVMSQFASAPQQHHQQPQQQQGFFGGPAAPMGFDAMGMGMMGMPQQQQPQMGMMGMQQQPQMGMMGMQQQPQMMGMMGGMMTPQQQQQQQQMLMQQQQQQQMMMMQQQQQQQQQMMMMHQQQQSHNPFASPMQPQQPQQLQQQPFGGFMAVPQASSNPFAAGVPPAASSVPQHQQQQLQPQQLQPQQAKQPDIFDALSPFAMGGAAAKPTQPSPFATQSQPLQQQQQQQQANKPFNPFA